MLPKPSLPWSVQHRWALHQATQRPPLVFKWEPILLKRLSYTPDSYKRVGHPYLR